VKNPVASNTSFKAADRHFIVRENNGNDIAVA